MEEDGCSKAQGVYTVQQATCTSDSRQTHTARLFAPNGDAAVALQRLHHQMTQGARSARDQCHGKGLTRHKGCDASQQSANHTAHRHAYDPTGPIEALADIGQGRWQAQLARYQMLRQGGHLHGQHQKENQKCAFVGVMWKLQQQECRHMAHAVHAHHDAPLQLGIALQKPLRVVRQHAGHGNGKEHINWNQHRKQIKTFIRHQHVLQRQYHKESQYQTAMVGAARGRYGNEFA